MLQKLRERKNKFGLEFISRDFKENIGISSDLLKQQSGEEAGRSFIQK